VVTTRDSQLSCAALAARDPLRQRIVAEYLEMPGMALLPVQAARLWAVERARIEPLLDDLRADGFLVCNAHGAYHRSGARAADAARW
jgi:hypothetical protein